MKVSASKKLNIFNFFGCRARLVRELCMSGELGKAIDTYALPFTPDIFAKRGVQSAIV